MKASIGAKFSADAKTSTAMQIVKRKESEEKVCCKFHDEWQLQFASIEEKELLCKKSFKIMQTMSPNIISFYPHHSPVGKLLLLHPFSDEKTNSLSRFSSSGWLSSLRP